MPQRFLRPGITNSERWNRVSFAAQSFYIRILTHVDDFGRYDARVPVLHGHCWAMRDDVTPQQTAALRSELVAANLIEVYAVDGREFLQITQWQERARSDRSKYPDKPQSNGNTSQVVDFSTPAADRSRPQESAASIVPRSSFLDHRSSSIAPTEVLQPSSPAMAARGAQTQTPKLVWSEPEGWLNISDEMRNQWGAAYPACDIDRQLAAASAWLRANPRKAHKSNWSKFITSWMSRSQDKGGDVGANRKLGGGQSGLQHQSSVYSGNALAPVNIVVDGSQMLAQLRAETKAREAREAAVLAGEAEE